MFELASHSAAQLSTVQKYIHTYIHTLACIYHARVIDTKDRIAPIHPIPSISYVNPSHLSIDRIGKQECNLQHQRAELRGQLSCVIRRSRISAEDPVRSACRADGPKIAPSVLRSTTAGAGLTSPPTHLPMLVLNCSPISSAGQCTQARNLARPGRMDLPLSREYVLATPYM